MWTKTPWDVVWTSLSTDSSLRQSDSEFHAAGQAATEKATELDRKRRTSRSRRLEQRRRCHGVTAGRHKSIRYCASSRASWCRTCTQTHWLTAHQCEAAWYCLHGSQYKYTVQLYNGTRVQLYKWYTCTHTVGQTDSHLRLTKTTDDSASLWCCSQNGQRNAVKILEVSTRLLSPQDVSGVLSWVADWVEAKSALVAHIVTTTEAHTTWHYTSRYFHAFSSDVRQYVITCQHYYYTLQNRLSHTRRKPWIRQQKVVHPAVELWNYWCHWALASSRPTRYTLYTVQHRQTMYIL